MQTESGTMLPIGIDLGNFSCKVASLGRTGTQVLPNALSNRETPTLVSLGGGRRLVGEAATTQRTSNVAGTLWNIRALLGRVCATTGDSTDRVLSNCEQPYLAWQGFQLVPTADGGLATLVEGEILPLESIAAACLGDCIATVNLAAAQGLVRAGEPLVTLAAPAWGFTASKLTALANAATIAELSVTEVLSEAAAAGLFYATERLDGLLRDLSGGGQATDDSVGMREVDADTESNDEVIILDDEEEDGPADSASDSPAAVPERDVILTTATVVFVDVGHGGTSASLVAFDNVARSIQVLDTAGAEVGGRDIDVLMAERFQQVAVAAHPGLVLDPNDNDKRVLRARQRIFSATDESKKVLSVNDSDTAMLEELAEGLDVRCNTNREELNEMLLSSGVLNTMMQPVEQVLQRAAANEVKVDAIELYGGTARVPLISSQVLSLASKYIEAPLIRRSLNGSEAVARGCALYAAMALPTFNDARRIQLTDTTPYDSTSFDTSIAEGILSISSLLQLACLPVRWIPAAVTVSVVLTAPPPPAAAVKGEASKLLSPEARCHNSDKTGCSPNSVDKPVLHVGRGSPLPSPMFGSPSARLRLSDVKDGAAVLTVGYTDPAQLPTGVVEGFHGTAIAPIPIATHRLEIVDSGMKTPAAAAGDAISDGAGETNEPDTREIEVGFALSADLSVICVQRNGPPCEIVASNTFTVGAMNPEALATATKAEEAMVARSAAIEQAEAARNSLESAIYRYRDEVLTATSEGKLEDDARHAIEEALLAGEDWLYEDETYDIIDAAVFDDKLAQIQGLVDAHLHAESSDEQTRGDANETTDDDKIDN